jgi:hypothetical protein
MRDRRQMQRAIGRAAGAATTVAAFSKAFSVTMSRGRMFSISSITISPEA